LFHIYSNKTVRTKEKKQNQEQQIRKCTLLQTVRNKKHTEKNKRKMTNISKVDLSDKLNI